MRIGPDPSRTIGVVGSPAAARDLAIASIAIGLLSTVVEGPARWVVMAGVFVAVSLGTLQLLGDTGSSSVARGVPVESLILPAVTAVALTGSIHLVPIGPLLIPALAAGAWLLVRIVGTEARLLANPAGPTSADRTTVLAEALAVGFLAFIGFAALVTGGLPEPGPVVASPTGLSLATLAAVDAVTAFLLGYRAAALRSTNLRDVAWSALTSAGVVAIAAVAVRAMEIPRLLGPALLVLVFFLWDAIQGGGSSRRRAARRIWDAVLLLIVGGVVIAWSLRLRG